MAKKLIILLVSSFSPYYLSETIIKRNVIDDWTNRFQIVKRGTVSKYYFALNISTVSHACSDLTFKECGLEEPNDWTSAFGYFENFEVLHPTDGKLTTCCGETSGLDFSNTMITFENDTDVFSVVLDEFDRRSGFRQLSTESIKKDSESFRKFRGFNGFFVKNYYPFELFNQNRNWNHDKINMLIFFKQHFPSQFNIRCLDQDCAIYPKLFYRNSTEQIKFVDNELTNDTVDFPYNRFNTTDDGKRRELNQNILNLLKTLKKNSFCSEYIDPEPHLKSEVDENTTEVKSWNTTWTSKPIESQVLPIIL